MFPRLKTTSAKILSEPPDNLSQTRIRNMQSKVTERERRFDEEKINEVWTTSYKKTSDHGNSEIMLNRKKIGSSTSGQSECATYD